MWYTDNSKSDNDDDDRDSGDNDDDNRDGGDRDDGGRYDDRSDKKDDEGSLAWSGIDSILRVERLQIEVCDY